MNPFSVVHDNFIGWLEICRSFAGRKNIVKDKLSIKGNVVKYECIKHVPVDMIIMTFDFKADNKGEK